jgi:hypothetical protein
MTTNKTDRELIQRFEAGDFDGHEFRHQDHMKVVWLYLQQQTLLETLDCFAKGLKRLAVAKGKLNLYHETITWAYVVLINERMGRIDDPQGWMAFERTNPDLFDWKNSILKRYYEDETLGSELARTRFVLPDRQGGRAAAAVED